MAKNNNPVKEKDIEKQRLDKWLWAARFYKTRRLAAEAISGGKIHVNGQRAKASKEVQVSTTLQISKNQYSWDINILALNEQRRPASEAVLLYAEAPESLQRRQALIALNKATSASRPSFEKPNKKQRRQIHRFKTDNST